MQKPFIICLKPSDCQPSIQHKWLTITALCLLLSFVQHRAMAQQNTHQTDTLTIKTTPAEANSIIATDPEPYGGMRNFYHFIGRRLRFDNTTQRQRAIVALVVEKDGSLTHIRILKSNMSDDMNAQIIRAVYLFSWWTPGTENSHPVRQQFTFPVTNY